MARLNWANRQNPGEFDESAPPAVTYEFDYTHAGGVSPWPAKFGPVVIAKAWKHGLVVYAEILDFPRAIAVQKSRWFGGVFQVEALEGWKIPQRVFTRTTTKGLSATGELIDE